MGRDIFTLTSLLTSLQFMLSLCYTGERFEIVIYQKIEPRNSSLSCLYCFNGDTTKDCMTLRNISNIPTQTCRLDEPFCKVRRLEVNGILKTFDRYCARQCDPGCREGALYSECVSCCNHESLCNTDNSASTLTCSWLAGWLFFVGLINLFVKL